jgi:hypothetical protein
MHSTIEAQFAAKNLIEKVKGRLLEIIQKFRATLTKDDLERIQKAWWNISVFLVRSR